MVKLAPEIEEQLPENVLESFRPEAVEDEEGDESGLSYWAAESPGDVLGGLLERRTDINRSFESDPIYNKIWRSEAYYYGFFDDSDDSGDTAIQVTGEHGQVLTFTLNYYRYLLRQLLTLVTEERPRYQATPANTDNKSRVQARLGNRVLEFYLRKRQLHQRMKETMEDALVYGTGFLKVFWNPALGERIEDERDPGEFFYEGDVDAEVLDFENVIWDFRQLADASKMNWVGILSRVSRWDLIARFPEFKTEILNAESRAEDETTGENVEGLSEEDREEDYVTQVEFFHKRSDAIPEGRYILGLIDGTVFLDMENPYRRLPVHVVRPSKIRKMALGWTPAFDIQKPQELLNEELAKIATVHDNLGLPLLWSPLGAKIPDPSQYLGNIARFESEKKPEIVNLAEVPTEVFNTIEFLIREMEKVVGLNSALQGVAQGSVRANRMQIFMAEQAIRFNSNLEQSYIELFENVGESILQLLQDFPEKERTIQVVGEKNAEQLIQFGPADLYSVSGVVVDTGSSILRTTEGKLEVVGLLSQNRIPVPKEEIVAILNGAPLEALTEGVEGQNDVATRENESLMSGEGHQALATDNHLYHMKKHVSVLNSPSARNDPQLAEDVLVAVMEHIEMYNDPGIFELQLALGYAEIPPRGASGEALPQEGGAPEEGIEAPPVAEPIPEGGA